MNDFRFTGEKCPVCGETFFETDDIVVCPLCGTPHHRECYKKNGECGNSDKHSEGFVWKEENPVEQSATEQPAEQSQIPQFAADMPVPPFVQVQNPLDAFPPELEEGVPTEDAAAYIKYGVPNYLNKFFIENTGKRTFNFAAFLFGGYWFIYRKMYKLGIIFLAITLLLTSIPMFIPQYAHLNADIQKLSESYQDMALSSDSVDEVNNFYSELLNTIKKYPAGIAVQIIVYAAEVGFAIYLGFTANKKYKNHISSKIKEINSTAQTEDLRKWRIISDGGRNMGMAILSGFVLYGLQVGVTLLSNLVIK